MADAIDVEANCLLRALCQSAPGPWQDKLELVDLSLGTVLHEPYHARSHVYFPVSAVVSLLYVLADGNSAEIAVIGCEGVVGISLFLGDGITPSRAVVQCSGKAIRMDAQSLRQQFIHRGDVALLLLRFTQALIAQMSQTAVCNRHHPVEQHLCRWILLMLDRRPGDEMVMTHDLIADMLGVRRASVSLAAAKLQKQGLIEYGRGRIKVLDRTLIEQRVCECYAVVKGEYDRLLPALDASANPGLPGGSRHDAQRLAALRESGILDTPPEVAYDDITRQAIELLEVPIAMVSFLDDERDWFKSCVGFRATESPAETSFCNVFFTIDDDVVVVEDTQQDPRFATHPYVRGMPFIRFFAAVRMVYGGQTVGTLCVYDFKPRQLSDVQVKALVLLAGLAVRQLENSGKSGESTIRDS